MKNKGFTLIELLAVITILSIILMIVVVSVSSIITNSKNSLQKTQYNQILKAAEYYNNKEGLKDYDVCVNVSYLTENGYLKEDEIKNPKNGEKIQGSIKIKYNGNKYTYEYKDKNCSICKAVDGVVSTELGTKYTCKVKDNTNYTFYVLNEENGKVNLIMDRNICNDGTVAYTSSNNYCRYKWYDEPRNNTYGPITVMQALYEGTKDWNNIPDMVMNYSDENNSDSTDAGYTSIITNNGVTTITGKPKSNTTTIGTSLQPLKARLPKESEVTRAGCTSESSSCPVWLIENMTYYNALNDKYSINNNTESYQNQIQGYWLLASSYNDNRNDYASLVSYPGGIGQNNPAVEYYGVRPVITVLNSNLSN